MKAEVECLDYCSLWRTRHTRDISNGGSCGDGGGEADEKVHFRLGGSR